MLGELYGWAHADTAPLFNDCATAALAYLGYTFDPADYDAFVAAHDQFKQIYQREVGQLSHSQYGKRGIIAGGKGEAVRMES
jgi:hypothetical protein